MRRYYEKNPNSILNAYIKGPSPRVRVFGKFLEWSRLVSAKALRFQGFEGLKEEIQRGERLVVDRVHSSVLQKQGKRIYLLIFHFIMSLWCYPLISSLR